MTKEELNNRTDIEFSATENALINFNIYYNAEHIEYYENFKKGNYQFCYDYLIKNRHILTLEHTPEKYKHIAKAVIENAKEFYNPNQN